MLKITFVVDGTPVPKGRPRFSLGHVYTPQRTREFEAKVRGAAKAAMRGRPATDMPVVVVIFIARPSRAVRVSLPSVTVASTPV